MKIAPWKKKFPACQARNHLETRKTKWVRFSFLEWKPPRRLLAAGISLPVGCKGPCAKGGEISLTPRIGGRGRGEAEALLEVGLGLWKEKKACAVVQAVGNPQVMRIWEVNGDPQRWAKCLERGQFPARSPPPGHLSKLCPDTCQQMSQLRN